MRAGIMAVASSRLRFDTGAPLSGPSGETTKFLFRFVNRPFVNGGRDIHRAFDAQPTVAPASVCVGDCRQLSGKVDRQSPDGTLSR
jgi:hypothetical protein